MIKALLVPLDDRPITYIFPQMVADVAGITALVPPRDAFGSLSRAAEIEALFSWIDSALEKDRMQAIFACADTLIHGGLIHSRRGKESLGTLKTRLANMTVWKKKASNAPIFVQSSIMRIADNHDATTEKEYWSRYGREIFALSTVLHRLSAQASLPPGLLRECEMRIPETIRKDYLASRYRNFQINYALLDSLSRGTFDRLIFSLDDSGEYGMNVLEQERLAARIGQLNLTDRAITYAGADEVLCTMLAWWLIKQNISKTNNAPSVVVKYALPATERTASRYEGQSIGNSLRAQLSACGLKSAEPESEAAKEAIFTVVVHAGENGQGDHMLLPGHQDLRSVDTKDAVEATLAHIAAANGPVVLTDVAYANGADPALVTQLLKRQDLVKKLWGYAGWNTSGNSIGSALALGVARWVATDAARSDLALKRSLFVRFLDDWAYQSELRPKATSLPVASLNAELKPYIEKISDALSWQPAYTEVSYPWGRPFEIEVSVDRVMAVGSAAR